MSADEAAAGEPDQEVTEEVLILKSARAEQEARKMADGGDFEGSYAPAAFDRRRAAAARPQPLQDRGAVDRSRSARAMA